MMGENRISYSIGEISKYVWRCTLYLQISFLEKRRDFMCSPYKVGGGSKPYKKNPKHVLVIRSKHKNPPSSYMPHYVDMFRFMINLLLCFIMGKAKWVH